MARGKSLLLGLFVGGVVSAGVTLLNAPKSGKETRADIKAQADELKRTIESLKEDVKNSLNRLSMSLKKALSLSKNFQSMLKIQWNLGKPPLNLINKIFNCT